MALKRESFLFLFTAMLCFHSLLRAEGKSIKVVSQRQFDAAIERVNSGEETNIILKKGIYVLKKSIKTVSPFSICGSNATITCADKLYSSQKVRSTDTHDVYKLDRQLTPFTLFYDNTGKMLPVSESIIDSVKVNYVEGEIVAPSVYEVGVNLKIPISHNLKHLRNKYFDCAYGYFDCGWRTVSFALNKSDEKFFYCTTLSDCPPKNYQYDKVFYKKPIRFVIYNAEKKENSISFNGTELYVPKGIDSIYYLKNNDSSYLIPTITVTDDFRLDKVKFVGFGGITVNSKKENVCEITNCVFQNCLSGALDVNKENDGHAQKAMITGCVFKDCSVIEGYVVRLTSTFRDSVCITMQHCKISRYTGKVIYKNAKPSVYVNGDVEIKRNVMSNSCRGHITMNKGKIIVSGNFLYNTDSFNSHPMRNYSNDWGLVYCNHIFEKSIGALNNKVHHILLENNLFYGAYAYGGDARGIFIDDGRGDVVCNNNVILNTQYYSIDSRNVKLHDAASVRIKYEGNVVSSVYRLEAGTAVKGTDKPILGRNILLSPKKNKISNTEIFDKDYRLEVDPSSSCDGKKIKTSKSLYNFLKQHPSFDYIKKWL